MNNNINNISNESNNLNDTQKEQTSSMTYNHRHNGHKPSVISNIKLFSKRPIEFNDTNSISNSNCSHNDNQINMQIKSIDNSNKNDNTLPLNQLPKSSNKLILKSIVIVPDSNNYHNNSKSNNDNSPQLHSSKDMISTIKSNNNSLILPMLTNTKSIQYGSSNRKSNISFCTNNELSLSQSKSLSIRVFIIYKRVDYPLLITPKVTVKSLRIMISSLINLSLDVMELKHKEQNLMTSESDHIKVYDLVLQSMHPFFEVRKIRDISSFQVIQALHPHTYNHRVIIDNVSSIKELFNHLNLFYKYNLEEKEYYVEALKMEKFAIGFAFKNLAYDFKRFLTIMKSNDSKYSNLKVEIENENEGSLNKYLCFDMDNKRKKREYSNELSYNSIHSISSMKNKELHEMNNRFNKKITLRKHNFNRHEMFNCKMSIKKMTKSFSCKYLSMK